MAGEFYEEDKWAKEKAEKATKQYAEEISKVEGLLGRWRAAKTEHAPVAVGLTGLTAAVVKMQQAEIDPTDDEIRAFSEQEGIANAQKVQLLERILIAIGQPFKP
jgi:translation elongation factor EF-1beta